MISIDFTGQQVLVAGGSAGIGLGVARLFAQAGAQVAITGTQERGHYGEAVAGLEYHQLDAADDAAVKAFAHTWGTRPLDVLISAVGTVRYKSQEFEIETFRQIMDVNLIGVFHLCQVFRDRIIVSAQAKRAGAMVLFASLASFFATTNNPAYSASKGGLPILTKTLADKWGKKGIRINAIAPGFVESKLTQVSRDNAEIYESSIAHTPLGRWGTPEDMAGAALWLASPLAGFVTGQTIVVDGGISLSL